jgi:HemY protein
MARALVILTCAVLAVAAAWGIALLHGHLSFAVGSISVDTSTPVALAVLAALFVALYIVVRLLGVLLRLPRGWRAWRRHHHRARGDAAVTSALVALAAGDGGTARHEAARARRLLGDTAQTLLLTAEAARLAEREPEAEAAFRTLAARKDAAFLGLRGLFRLAMARQDFPAAAKLAGQAEAARPGGSWLRAERARLAVRTGDWSGALALANTNEPKAALATAAANASTDAGAAMKLAQLGWKADPGLAPAALAYATRLRAAGKERRALAVIRQSWARAPHPDLAAFALAGAGEPPAGSPPVGSALGSERPAGAPPPAAPPTGAPLKQYQAAQRLTEANPDHVESRLLLARTALTAGLPGEARRQAEAARAAGLDQRRLWLLLAEIEGDNDGGRQALQHALVAEPDPIWRCTSCHATQATWQPVCPACGTVGGLR